jgi:hypothetical protein
MKIILLFFYELLETTQVSVQDKGNKQCQQAYRQNSHSYVWLGQLATVPCKPLCSQWILYFHSHTKVLQTSDDSPRMVTGRYEPTYHLQYKNKRQVIGVTWRAHSEQSNQLLSTSSTVTCCKLNYKKQNNSYLGKIFWASLWSFEK